MTETFVEDVNQTPTACVSWCCMNAYRKQSCMYQSSVCTYFETVVYLSLSRSALVCLSSDLAYDECVLHFSFVFPGQWCGLFLYRPGLSALLIIQTLDWSCCCWRSVYGAFTFPDIIGLVLNIKNLTHKLIHSRSLLRHKLILIIEEPFHNLWVDIIFTVRLHTCMFLVSHPWMNHMVLLFPQCFVAVFFSAGFTRGNSGSPRI